MVILLNAYFWNINNLGFFQISKKSDSHPSYEKNNSINIRGNHLMKKSVTVFVDDFLVFQYVSLQCYAFLQVYVGFQLCVASSLDLKKGFFFDDILGMHVRILGIECFSICCQNVLCFEFLWSLKCYYPYSSFCLSFLNVIF